ncbi:flagellar hook-length control protein FliK [Limnohabitans sp.]|uniref:flagellar hook-length control protein FliK n=1 Tax=Limnohabitans sp. TaxID=1907725 RepID=UPI00333E6A74
MNLSNYLQMPPAPLVPNSSPSTAPQGAHSGAGPSAGASLGFDFAQVMARQMERLLPQDRQTFAADVPEHPQTEAHTQDSRPVEDERSEKRSDAAPSDDASDDKAPKHAHQRNKAVAQKAEGTDVEVLLEGLMQGAPVAPVTPAAPVLPAAPVAPVAPAAVLAPIANTHASLDAPTALATPATALQTVVLSPQVHLITDPNQAPSPESLAAFAKSMGLDESTIQSLLAQTPANSPSALTAGLPSPTNALQAAISTALNGASSDGVANANNTFAAQPPAIVASAQTPVAASGAGLAAAATTLVAPALPGLTTTDMATIQQLQITVLPAAVLPLNNAAIAAAANAPMPSTLDMLSLLGTGVDEQDVSALLSRFSEDAGSDSHPEQQQESSNEANNFSSFAQALNRSNNAAQAAASAVPTAANMGEVYDQLSDKMATEMAARMHKQLSDGEWKMKFALRPSNLGGVEIQLEMKDGKLDAIFRADNPLTRDLLQNSSQRLREALGNFGINAGQVNVGHGDANNPQNNSGHAGKQSQVRDNSSSQVNGSGDAISRTSAPQKGAASLLDLYV